MRIAIRKVLAGDGCPASVEVLRTDVTRQHLSITGGWRIVAADRFRFRPVSNYVFMSETMTSAEKHWRSQRIKWTCGFLMLSMAVSSLMNWISSLAGRWFVEIFAEPEDLAVYLDSEQLGETGGFLLNISLLVTSIVAFIVAKSIYMYSPAPRPRSRLGPPAAPQVDLFRQFWLPVLNGAGIYWLLFCWIFSLGMQVANRGA